MAFGNNLQQETKTTKLFRKVNSNNFLKSGEHCFSTNESICLIAAGEFAIVLREDAYEGLHDSQDADAGKNFGYDEFRVELSESELIEAIEAIVVPNWWEDDIDEDLYDTDKDPMVWIDNLRNYGKVVFEKDVDYNVDFNF